jgi:hypothetical protein
MMSAPLRTSGHTSAQDAAGKTTPEQQLHMRRLGGYIVVTLGLYWLSVKIWGRAGVYIDGLKGSRVKGFRV